MKYLKKCSTVFHLDKMPWGWVILFALITGIYTGLVMVPGFLKETSFQDIGISYECWVLFAVLVCVNCRKPWEAALKCFVFFLISQPLVYLTEILCGHLAFDMGLYYYRTIWLRATFLTLPGGFAAYYAKKETLFGSVILSIGNTILALLGCYYLLALCRDFPHHLLTFLFCFLCILFLTFSLQKKKSLRTICLLLPCLLSAGILLFFYIGGYSFV